MPLSSPSSLTAAEALLADLIHDLRQDLGTIETSVYCLNLSSDAKQARTRDYLRTIEQQVERAAGRLSAAAAELMRMQAQRAESTEARDLTKSVTSAVT